MDKEFAIVVDRALKYSASLFTKTPRSKHRALLERLIREADVALGVFNDPTPTKPNGWGWVIIKGFALIENSVCNNVPIEVSISAISCRELEEAVAMTQVFGDLH